MGKRNTVCVIDYSSRLRFLKLLMAMSLVCCVMTGMRVYWTKNLSYLFLIWNLFLAWVPLVIANKLQQFYIKFPNRYFISFLAGFVWLLFFPNSPYIITDLIHISAWNAPPVWFDVVLVFSFALTGLIAGFVSLYFIHEILDCLFNKTVSWFLISGILALSGYGIYLGRVQRWNSWDLFTNPTCLLIDAANSLENPQALFMTVVFTFVMIFSYLILHSIIHLKNHPAKENDQYK